MRRGLATLIIGLSLVLASLSWAGFSLLRTALNPDKSEDIADLAFENEEVKQIIISNFSRGIESQLPSDSPLTEGKLEDLTEQALANPNVESVIRNYFVETHQNALRGEDPPEVIKSDVIDQATSQVLEPLGIAIPGGTSIDLSTTGISLLGKARSFLKWFTPIGAFLSICGAGLALFITQDKPRVLRKVAYWAFGTSAFWLFVGIAIPQILQQLSPSSAVLATAIISAFFGSMIAPAIVLALMGVLLLVISKFWPKVTSDKALATLGQSKDSDESRLPNPQQQNTF